MKQVHGVQFAEVEVDIETGYIKPIKIVTIQDAGRVIDKLLFESQLLGGAIQGLSLRPAREPHAGRPLRRADERGPDDVQDRRPDGDAGDRRRWPSTWPTPATTAA